jgi:hypothetical protein
LEPWKNIGKTEAPRSGRPLLYTADVLNAAQDWFDQHAWQQLNKSEFVTELKELGILSKSASVSGFYFAFKNQGLHLKWAQRSLTFALTPKHEILREDWCIRHQGTFTAETLGSFWFCDEVVIEEGGHPKGKLQC